MESIKKIQTKTKLEVKTLQTQTGAQRQSSPTDYKMGKREYQTSNTE